MLNKKLLKAKMILQEKSQSEMAEVLGIAVVSVSKKINGVIKFNLEEVKKIKEYLNLTDEEINQIFLS